MSKNLENAYKQIKDKASELRSKLVLGPDKETVIAPLPDFFVPEESIPSLKKILIKLQPYVNSDVSADSVENQALHKETSHFFYDAEKFYTDVMGEPSI